MYFYSFKARILAFLHGSLVARLYQPQAFLDILHHNKINKQISSAFTKSMLEFAKMSPAEAIKALGSNEAGLSEKNAAMIMSRIGPNEVAHEQSLSWQTHLWLCYRNPFNILLTFLAVLSFITDDDLQGTIVIGSMVFISVTMRFFQERRSDHAAEKLKEMVSNTATVLRYNLPNHQEMISKKTPSHTVSCAPVAIELPIKNLVPGDIVQLSAGDMVPADLRVLSAKDLFVSQGTLTGESLPVEKFVTQSDQSICNPLELDNLCFMGTNILSGTALAIVIGTGEQTYFGALAKHVTANDRAPTSFQIGVNKTSWLLIRFMFVMAPLVLFINGFTKGDWLQAALFSLSVAVGLTPEMLPMIVTATLAKGASVMSQKKVIVKRLDAIQNFGAMDILCTDKTGTLTQDKIVLERYIDAFGVKQPSVLKMAYLNSYYQTGLKNLLDVAVLDHQAEIDQAADVVGSFDKVDEIPFDFSRRRMSVVVSERDNHHLLICKGAVEEVLSICTHIRQGDKIETLTKSSTLRVREVAGRLNQDGLRVVAVALKKMPPDRMIYTIADESELTLIGYVAFLDPPKETAAPALNALKKSGITVKVLTGDNELVALKVCKDVGLIVNQILSGSKIDAMSDQELIQAAKETVVFARLSPTHKERLVRLLRTQGHVVGFMGDGINDAPALRAADIGISVDSAIDIAKEAADIILLEKSLLVLVQGVREGRKVFANMLKYIKMAASANFGNVFSVLIASAFLPFLPMLPIHLLVQNLLYDISQMAIPFDHVDEELLEKPQRWHPEELGRFMLYFGPLSSIFDIATFWLMWYVFGANTPEHQTLFQTGWFVEGLVSQTMIVHMIRTRKIPFIQSCASWSFILTTAAVIAVGIFLPMGPLAAAFKLQALPLSYFPWLALILLCYMTVVQMMKSFYTRRYSWH